MNPEDVRAWDGGASMAITPAAPGNGGAVVAVEQSRAIAEAQAALIIAKQFPRSEVRAEKRIIEACKRRSLAKVAEYAYPRGKTLVRGPSIRLAEVAARHWENLDYGLRELSQGVGFSEVEAFCWDKETNTRVSRIFQAKHIRRVGSSNKDLEDPRDIYEMVANQGQRRVRACILEIIPGDVIEAAREQCQKTLQEGDKPLIDRIKSMIQAFETKKVSQAQIEARMGKRVEDLLEDELADLRAIFASIKDGLTKPGAWFASPSETAKNVTPEPPPADQPQDQAGASPEASAPPPTTSPEAAMARDEAITAAIWTALKRGEVMEDGVTPIFYKIRGHAKALAPDIQRLSDGPIRQAWGRVLGSEKYKEWKAGQEEEAPATTTQPASDLLPETRERLEALIEELGIPKERLETELVPLDSVSEAGAEAYKQSLRDMAEELKTEKEAP